MFKDSVIQTPWSDDMVAASTNVYGDTYYNDISFVSTLRALLENRKPPEERVDFRLGYISYKKPETGNIMTLFERSGISVRMSNTIQLVTINLYEDENVDEWIEFVESDLKNNAFYKRIDKVTEFFKRSFKVLCYINIEEKSVLLVTDRLSLQKFHYLQCALFAFMPWYFNPKDGLTEDERNLIDTLRKRDASEYLRVLGEMAEKCNFRDKKIIACLKDFETKSEEMTIQRLENRLDELMREIENRETEIRESYRKKVDLDERLLGYRLAKQNKETHNCEIMNYFLNNKLLVLESSEVNDLTFGVKTQVEFFDKDLALETISNLHSYIYSENYTLPASDTKKLFEAIFKDEKIKINIAAVFTIYLSGGVRGRARWTFGSQYVNHLPNPHINEYSCLGNYGAIINDLLASGDYLMAIEQCIASAKSLNFADSTVMSKFARMIRQEKVDYKFLVMENDDILSPMEAVEVLKEGENE